METQFQRANPWAVRLVLWLRDPEKTFRRWQGIHTIAAAWLGLGLAAFSPPHGAGINVCWMNSLTGVPCLGCGLTRSLSCALRGLWEQSWQYHPFGLPILLLFVMTVLVGLSPHSWRERLARYAGLHAMGINLFYVTLVTLFVIYGFGRSLLYLFSGMR